SPVATTARFMAGRASQSPGAASTSGPSCVGRAAGKHETVCHTPDRSWPRNPGIGAGTPLALTEPMLRVLSFSLHRPIVLLTLAAGFAVAGAFAFWHLPIEAFPELADPQVQVITLFPGHAAEEVERQVTLPVEHEMNGLPGLTRMHSFSIFGLSFVVLTFDDGTDLYFARQQVNERLAQVDAPDGVKPTLGPLSTPTGEIYRYTLVGEGYSPMQLREIEDWVMERHLKQVPGVADVVSFGGFVKQYQVQVDPGQLQARGVTLRQVYVVRGLGTLAGAGDIEQVVVAARGGIPIRIRDLARVTVGAFPRRGVVTRDH